MLCRANLESGWLKDMKDHSFRRKKLKIRVINEESKGISLKSIIELLLIPIFLGAGAMIINSHVQVSVLSEQIEQLTENINTNSENISTMNQTIATMDKEIARLRYDISASDIKPTKIMQEAISREYNSIDHPNGLETNLVATSVVAYNEVTGEEYTVERFAEIQLLLPYTSNNQEVIFYGSFNESGQWDGNCTLNVYEDNKLVLITDAEYKDGSLLSSKQVFSYELQSGELVWALSDRIYENGIGIGDTHLYAWEHGYTKGFTLDDVTVKDVLHAEEFISSLEPRLTAYYSGDISDGFFNDDSGNAYMVYFFEDGTVRLLYSGRFKDGTFDDDTGEAWYIVKEENTDYMYYKGNFENGAEDHSSITELGHPPLTLEEIEAYIGDREYGVELRWAGFESVPSMVNMV